MKSIITIARQFGSGGHEVGEKLAQRLGVPFYDKELIAMAAKESGMSEEIFEKADERASNSLLYSLFMGNFNIGSRGSVVTEMPLNDKLYILQADLIKQAAQKGPCVVVGRCADYVLRDCENVFNVFIHADMDSRVERAIKNYGIPQEKARDVLQKKDKQRAGYYNFYTSNKWGDLQNYHMTLDSSYLGVEGAVELILRGVETAEAR